MVVKVLGKDILVVAPHIIPNLKLFLLVVEMRIFGDRKTISFFIL